MVSFRSEITKRLLNYFFINPDEERYVNELAKILEVDPKNLDRKLKELVSEGLFCSEFRGKEKYYFLNKKFPLLNEYKKIVEKTVGLEYVLRAVLGVVEGIKEAYVFGSYAVDKLSSGSDIDLLIIGSHGVLEAQKAVLETQRRIGREINIVDMSESEFKKRKLEKDALLTDILNKPIIRIV